MFLLIERLKRGVRRAFLLLPEKQGNCRLLSRSPGGSDRQSDRQQDDDDEDSDDGNASATVRLYLCAFLGGNLVDSRQAEADMTFYRAALFVGIAGVLGTLIWLDINGEGWRSWLRPQPILSVVTLIVGFVVLGWQLRRQHKNTLDANRRQSQDRLKLEIYNEIARRLEAASLPIIEAAMTPMAVVGELGIRLQYSMPSSHQPASLHSLSVNLDRAVASLTAVLETYEIVMPEFTVFRKELADAARRLRVALGDFMPLAIPFVVADSARISLHWPPNKQDMDEMSRLANIANDAGFDVRGVLYDLRVEAQNYLLGELYGRRLPKRAPTDPSMKVTSITQKAQCPR